MGSRRGKATLVAQSVRWHRLNAGLTPDELALRAGIAPNTLRKLERGYRARMLGGAAEAKVADALGVTVEAIAFGAADDAEPMFDLVEMREGRGLSIVQTAEGAGVPPTVLRRAEAGVAISPRYALRLADFYGCRVTDFYPRESRAAA